MSDELLGGIFSDGNRNVMGIALLSGASGALAGAQGNQVAAFALAVVAWACVVWLLVYGDLADDGDDAFFPHP